MVISRVISEATLFKLATSAAGLTYRVWARKYRHKMSGDANLEALVAGRFRGLPERTMARRHLEDMAQELHAKMQPMLGAEYGPVPAHELEAASAAVAALLERSELSAADFLEVDLDPSRLENLLLGDAQYRAEVALLAPGATVLAQRLVRDVSNYVVDIVMSLPDFNASAARELLNKASRVS